MENLNTSTINSFSPTVFLLQNMNMFIFSVKIFLMHWMLQLWESFWDRYVFSFEMGSRGHWACWRYLHTDMCLQSKSETCHVLTDSCAGSPKTPLKTPWDLRTVMHSQRKESHVFKGSTGFWKGSSQLTQNLGSQGVSTYMQETFLYGLYLSDVLPWYSHKASWLLWLQKWWIGFTLLRPKRTFKPSFIELNGHINKCVCFLQFSLLICL